MSNTLGEMFRISTWGESHGDAIGVTVDGCPPRLPLAVADIQKELDRRRPGQSEISTQRKEGDQAEILSGVFEGLTLGTPILVSVWNRDARSRDYEHMRTTYRPSHADYTTEAKYGIRNWQGGGRASARETATPTRAASSGWSGPDAALQEAVPGPEDLAHATLPDGTQQPVGPDLIRDSGLRSGRRSRHRH